MTQEWVDRHTPNPETLAKIRAERARMMRKIKGKDTDNDMAMQYLGLCPECKGMVNFGHMYTRRNGTAYHTDCDPNKPAPTCWCGEEITPPETEHQGCYNTRMAFSWWGKQLQSIYSPLPVAKFPRYRR